MLISSIKDFSTAQYATPTSGELSSDKVAKAS
jgi:hypothetical protein